MGAIAPPVTGEAENAPLYLRIVVPGPESAPAFQVSPHLALGVPLLDRFAFVALLPAAYESELDLDAVATSIQ